MSKTVAGLESKLKEILPENLKVLSLEVINSRIGRLLTGTTEEPFLYFAVAIPQNPTLEEVDKIASALRDRLLSYIANKVVK